MTMRMGRPSIFGGGKVHRVETMITKIGKQRFEQARARLAAIVGRAGSTISNADTLEFLARGEAETIAYLNLGKRSV